LNIVFYGYETWSLTLREERRLRVFENRVLRRIFGPKRDELQKESRKLHNEELNALHSPPTNVQVIKSRRMRCSGHVARRWEYNIKADHQEVGFGGMDWIELSQDGDGWWIL
jgi:hypothetical protein